MKNRLQCITILGLTLLLVASFFITGCAKAAKKSVAVEETKLSDSADSRVSARLGAPPVASEEIIAVLRVGDKLPYFSTDFPDDDEMVLRYQTRTIIRERRIINEVVTGTLTFEGKIFLRDGTVYHAPELCVIDYSNGVITEGRIRIIKNK